MRSHSRSHWLLALALLGLVALACTLTPGASEPAALAPTATTPISVRYTPPAVRPSITPLGFSGPVNATPTPLSGGAQVVPTTGIGVVVTIIAGTPATPVPGSGGVLDRPVTVTIPVNTIWDAITAICNPFINLTLATVTTLWEITGEQTGLFGQMLCCVLLPLLFLIQFTRSRRFRRSLWPFR